MTDKSRSITYVLLEFSGKTEKEAKVGGNRESWKQGANSGCGGRIVENGVITGTYKDIGVALSYNSEDEAKRVAGILDGAPAS